MCKKALKGIELPRDLHCCCVLRRKKSDVYARNVSLASYEHVLHPRTTGFGFIAERLRDSELQLFIVLYSASSNNYSASAEHMYL